MPTSETMTRTDPLNRRVVEQMLGRRDAARCAQPRAWMTAAVFDAAKGFRRVKGCKDVPALVTALRWRDEQLGLTTQITTERVA